ncbi:MAG: FKBP-type peptidyl-prolyl cis-trans isomerase [Candidatus Micrarchaeales archaeon]
MATEHKNKHAETKAAEHKTEKKGFKAKPMYIAAAAIVAVIVLVGIYFAIGNVSARAVAVGDTIQVNYTGTFTNGTVFDASSLHGQPLRFVVGAGQVIPGFDQGVVGMKLNQQKTLTIPPSMGYGEINASLIFSVPLSVFGNQTVQKGMVVTRTSNGQQAQGIVDAVNATNATINFNPPLAGQTLIFKIQVVGIKAGSG